MSRLRNRGWHWSWRAWICVGDQSARRLGSCSSRVWSRRHSLVHGVNHHRTVWRVILPSLVAHRHRDWRWRWLYHEAIFIGLRNHVRDDGLSRSFYTSRHNRRVSAIAPDLVIFVILCFLMFISFGHWQVHLTVPHLVVEFMLTIVSTIIPFQE